MQLHLYAAVAVLCRLCLKLVGCALCRHTVLLGVGTSNGLSAGVSIIRSGWVHSNKCSGSGCVQFCDDNGFMVMNESVALQSGRKGGAALLASIWTRPTTVDCCS